MVIRTAHDTVSAMHSNEAPLTEPNAWQRVSDATGTVITPANLIDAAGFVGAKYGIDHFDSWQGIFAAAASFLSDVVDGRVARATGTASPLGEAIDAAGDKAKLAYALYKMDRLQLAPRKLLGAVALQNGCNAILTTADQVVHKDGHVLHPSWFGKRAMFLQQTGVGLHVIAAQMENDTLPRSRQVRAVANILGWGGVALGAVATADYSKRFFGSLRRPKH